MMGIGMPEEWAEIVKYSEGPHATFSEIRSNMPDRDKVRKAMTEFLDSCQIANCHPQATYIASMGLKPIEIK